MLYDTPHVRVEAADGVATLWLEFPGLPVNALTPPRLAEIDRALSTVLPNPHVDVLVVRSGKPAGFCGGHNDALETDEDRTAFALAGQRVLNRLAAADFVTVAFLEGPCLGPGLELALACDYRLAVSGPDAWLGFPVAPPCWGGSGRLGRKAARVPAGGVVTAREARKIGLVDDAFCARRAKVELRGWLDRLLVNPRKRARPVPPDSLARERAAFRRSGPPAAATHPVPCPVLPGAVAVTGAGGPAARLVVELAIRGGTVVTSLSPSDALAESVRRGRVTPLEADQARQRVRPTGDAAWVLACDARGVRVVKPRTPPVDLVVWLRSLGYAAPLAHPPADRVRWRHAAVADEARPALARGA
jgi:enoyl-CoA hydratase